MRRFRKATIKDVALRAGVSITTVSRFVSGFEDVCSAETAERIRSAVSTLNYTPSSLVSGMQKQTTATLGVCMFNPLDQHVAYGGLFFERLWRGILSEANQRDYSVLHYPGSVRDGARCEPFLDGRVDGVLYHAHTRGNTRPARLAMAGMPTVLLTRSLDLPEGCGSAYADESGTADLALSHLWSLGHRRIAHVAGPSEEAADLERQTEVDDIAVQRLEAYRAWMQRRGVYDEALIAHARGWTGAHVPEIAAAWAAMPEPPTAVFCANDLLALAVIAEAQRRGLRVPEELSVVGVDNSNAARDSGIPLTSVEVPVEEVGRQSVNALFRLMQGAPIEECRIALPVTEIVVRSSTGPLSR